MLHSKACAVAVPSNTVLLNLELANSVTISLKVLSALLWYSCHPLSALMGQPLGGCSTLSRSLTTLIMVPATGMSTRALSPKHPILASQMESLMKWFDIVVCNHEAYASQCMTRKRFFFVFSSPVPLVPAFLIVKETWLSRFEIRHAHASKVVHNWLCHPDGRKEV